MNKDTDRLDWLREIRQKIVRKCGNDPKVMGDYFRSCQKQYEDRIITDINVINSPETVPERISA
ncbi:MAG: hypothetical protein GY795_31770 [Desulfobacterales bacterium]|nr:hypothetical protein [Desulfobacterales bacterium]